MRLGKSMTTSKMLLSVLLISAAVLPSGAQSSHTTLPGWMLGPFVRATQGEPVIDPDAKATFTDPIRKAPVHWQALHTFNPAAIVRDGKIVVLYRAEDNTGAMEIGGHTSRIGMATSTDGVQFDRRSEPVFYPANDAQRAREWPGGTEDPRIVEGPDGMYVLTYTQWNRKNYRVGIATSRDLIHWKKWGPAFQDAGPKYATFLYKSAGIVTELKGGRLIAAKIHGKYWMYWGEKQIRLATSEDLIHWTPVEDAQGKTVVVLGPRRGHFDSGFPEVGPPPVLTRKGILLIYNGKNGDGPDSDKQIGAGAYASGEALFSTDNPEKLLERSAEPVLKPEMPYERTGQYTAGTTFAEGLVYSKGKWFLYYGCADSRVAVVMADGTEFDAELKQ
jgi:beta-1,2-mannosidase